MAVALVPARRKLPDLAHGDAYENLLAGVLLHRWLMGKRESMILYHLHQLAKLP
jgi:hypothetical protein